MDDFELEIKKEFVNEALINLEEVESSFMELENASDPKPLLDKIFRLAHNLKGGSRAVGFGEVAEFTHQLESLVLKIQKDEVGLSGEVVTTLLRSNDRLVEMLSELKNNMSATFDNADILVDIQAWLNGTKVASSAASVAPAPQEAASSAPTEAVITASAELVAAPAEEVVASAASVTQMEGPPPTEPAPQVPDANAFFAEGAPTAPVATAEPVHATIESAPVTVPAPAPAAAAVAVEPAVASAPPMAEPPPAKKAPASGGGDKGGGKEDEIIRVSLARIDMLNDYVGELIVLQSVVQQLASSVSSLKLQASIRQMVKLSKDIQSLTMSLRMLPVKPLVQKLQRVVRDTAKALEKEVSFEVHGEMDIDKSVLDRLADPLIHILRNAVDHGLEMPDDRVKAGKSSQGHVLLSFSNEGNHLVVEARDDGKGINTEVLRKKAIEKRLISESQQLTEKQLINLIFHPGFSTKAVTSEISGRGVGMDVVKTNVEKIGGSVEVTTNLGKGSIFRLQIPLSLAVVEGLVVTGEKSRYVVPLSQVQETVNLRSHKIFADKLGIGSCFELRGIVVPLFGLDEVLGASKKGTVKLDGTALIVNVEDRPMAVVVHDIVRAQQIVIKPFSNGLMAQKGWVGTCVLGDGMPTLILSPVDILSGRIIQSQIEQNLGGVA